MRWPGERDGSRPPVWAQGAVWISRWLSTSPAGGERPGVVKTPRPFNPFACGTANPKQIRGPGCCPLEHARRPV